MGLFYQSHISSDQLLNIMHHDNIWCYKDAYLFEPETNSFHIKNVENSGYDSVIDYDADKKIMPRMAPPT